MFKYVCKYKDFDGIEREETCYFNLTESEVIEAQLSRNGYAETLERIAKAVDAPALMREFKNILLNSYGVKSDDGRHFMKNDRIREEFQCSVCYDEIFKKMISDSDFAASFVKAVMPESNGGDKPLINDHNKPNA